MSELLWLLRTTELLMIVCVGHLHQPRKLRRRQESSTYCLSHSLSKGQKLSSPSGSRHACATSLWDEDRGCLSCKAKKMPGFAIRDQNHAIRPPGCLPLVCLNLVGFAAILEKLSVPFSKWLSPLLSASSRWQCKYRIRTLQGSVQR